MKGGGRSILRDVAGVFADPELNPLEVAAC